MFSFQYRVDLSKGPCVGNELKGLFSSKIRFAVAWLHLDVPYISDPWSIYSNELSFDYLSNQQVWQFFENFRLMTSYDASMTS